MSGQMKWKWERDNDEGIRPIAVGNIVGKPTTTQPTTTQDPLAQYGYTGGNRQLAQEYMSKADKDFSYDVYGSALYNQYKNEYTRNALLGMEDTMGRAAALTGGYGNSYAQTAGQQAYYNQMEGLNDVAMQLYQMAYDKYNNDRAYNLNMADYYNTLDQDEKSAAQALYAADKAPVSLKGLERIEEELKNAKTNAEINAILDKYKEANQLSDAQDDALYALYRKDETSYTNEDGTLNYLAMAADPTLWEALGDGGANWLGIDRDAIVLTPQKEEMTLQALREAMVAQGADYNAATEAIKKLQQKLGISSNWLFGW